MKYADDYSGWGNSILYNMCTKRPLHDDIDTISSKLWIIGRSYSAAIERKAGKNFKIQKAAKIIMNSDIDEYIADILKVRRPTEKNIHRVLAAHKYLTDVLLRATGVEKRSLASKYLHFHSPNSVFIFDSIANNKVRSKLKGYRFKVSNDYDNNYESFCYRCIEYRNNHLEPKLGQLATPRRLDMELLQYGL